MGELIEHAEQVHAVGIAGFAQAGASQSRVELKALGLKAVAHRFDQQTTCLGHAQCCQAVEHGKSLLTDDAVQPLGGIHVATGGVVRQGVAQNTRRFALRVVDMAQTG